MKMNGAAFSHKTEIGGVGLNVATPSAAREVYQTLTGRVATAMPGAPADGVIVAPMVRDGVETILGVQVDPVFGRRSCSGLAGCSSGVSGRRLPSRADRPRGGVADDRGNQGRGARRRPILMCSPTRSWRCRTMRRAGAAHFRASISTRSSCCGMGAAPSRSTPWSCQKGWKMAPRRLPWDLKNPMIRLHDKKIGSRHP